jgi:AraC-like DNA-binding protein
MLPYSKEWYMMEEVDGRQLQDMLREKVLRWCPMAGRLVSAVPGLELFRRDTINERERCLYAPVIAVVLQGWKHSVIGNEDYDYGEGYCIVGGMDSPAMTTITQASGDRPFLALSLKLDRYLITQLLADTNAATDAGASPVAVSLEKTTPPVLDAFFRLVSLLDTPEEIPVLAPLFIRELHYRLLTGPQGEVLRAVSAAGSPCNRVAEAVSWLRENYAVPVRVSSLAERVYMSPRNFTRLFRQATSLSPLQFQKHMRLFEAKRLLVAEAADATRAALAVGYESVTQFTREYKRLFGAPPLRDAKGG